LCEQVSLTRLFSLISEYIKEASKRLTNELREQQPDELSILQQLILNRDKHKLTLEDIESIMVDFMMAGVDTVSAERVSNFKRKLSVLSATTRLP
jgi:cytochrome P450